MASTTTNYGAPFPTDTDLFQPHVDIANLANSLDSSIKTQVADKLQRVATTWAILSATTGNFIGQLATVTSDSVAFRNGDYRWSGTKWERYTPWIATTKSALTTTVSGAIPTAGPGCTATVTSDSTTANNGDYVWRGSSWGMKQNAGRVNGIIAANGYFSIPHTLGTDNIGVSATLCAGDGIGDWSVRNLRCVPWIKYTSSVQFRLIRMDGVRDWYTDATSEKLAVEYVFTS